MMLSICTSSLEKCLLKAFGYFEIGLSCYCWVVDVPIPGEILRLWDWGRLAVISQSVVGRGGKWVQVCLTFKRQQAFSPALDAFCLVFAVANCVCVCVCVCVWGVGGERENVRYWWEKIEREREKTEKLRASGRREWERGAWPGSGCLTRHPPWRVRAMENLFRAFGFFPLISKHCGCCELQKSLRRSTLPTSFFVPKSKTNLIRPPIP